MKKILNWFNKNILRGNKNDLLFITILILIIVHGCFNKYFKVDNTTVLLLLILILLPYLHLIRKIKYGDFEAEIKPEEVKKIEGKATKIPEKKQEDTLDFGKTDYLESLAQRDPELALAKVRIEIEKRLRSLGEIYLPKSKVLFHLGIRNILAALKKNKIIDSPLASVLEDVISVANRAIHGETVSKRSACKLIEISNKIIVRLDYIVIQHALSTEKAKKITQKKVENYLKARYKLTTIIPYTKNPEERIYELNQTELYAFLEGYEKTAEFIIKLEEMKDKK